MNFILGMPNSLGHIISYQSNEKERLVIYDSAEEAKAALELEKTYNKNVIDFKVYEIVEKV